MSVTLCAITHPSCFYVQVFLPLLVKHFTEGELRQLTSMVLELHHLQPQQPLQSAGESESGV